MLQLLDVSAGYDGSTVVHHVTVDVPDGSVVALLGPNGAGKTTSLRVAAGLLSPTRGRVVLDGMDVTRRPPYERAQRGLCLIPEGRGIFAALSVRENLVLQVTDGAEADLIDRAAQAFPRLGKRLNQIAGTLSGGEQQMLALARAHLARAKVVLLDEVSMGLAPVIVDEIFEFIAGLRTSGVSLLIVEQYVQRALEIADYAYVLSRGEVNFVGEPYELETSAVLESYLG
ncbi:MAG TPA: ATP-binding cassette domain-containing protein [Acidimicrobiales bacterium]|jgi:branched-chain amino acid transport system ATP-binding protein|nr:ATP-binding cassette domain-containing protein [Acidimicrobiales bacterium]